MDGNNGVGRLRRMSRETSPDRAKAAYFFNGSNSNSCRVNRSGLVAKRVQIVYYLSRNGQLEHPHFMELSHLPNQHLRLRDVMERLTVLRGKGMPALYSWSCKRSYKNGYVWNDLSENDVIYPADGAEYVLKGSEIIPGCTDRFQQLRITNRPAPKQLPLRHQIEPEPEYETEEEEYESEITNQSTHKLITSKQPNQQSELILDSSPPNSSSSSDPTIEPVNNSSNGKSSVFFNLISCGSAVYNSANGRKSGGYLEKRALSSKVCNGEEREEVRYMSENPRFGNMQGEDKEYLSGSVVIDAMRKNGNGEQRDGLKRSTSFNEERSSRLEIGECLVSSEDGGESMKGKCIPGSWKKLGTPNNKIQQQSIKK